MNYYRYSQRWTTSDCTKTLKTIKLPFTNELILMFFCFWISVSVHQAADWSINMSRNARMSQNVVNAKKNWREFAHHVHWNVHVCQNAKRLLPVPTVVFCAINVFVNASFALSWLKNKKSSKCLADHRKLVPQPRNKHFVFIFSTAYHLNQLIQNWTKNKM